MKLSIVTTLYQSSQHIQEFYERISKCANKITQDYEIIFVNDGSPDNSIDVAISLYERDKSVRIIDLSRNFGHHKAMMTGLSFARGDYIFLIDCDLEEEPELLEKFYTEYKKKNDIDVVYGVQESRKGGIIEKIRGTVFYKLFNLFSDHPIPANLVTVRLMSERYVKNLVRHRESEMIIGGIWAITGFKQMPFYINKKNRDYSSYSASKRVALFINAITSFSSTPLVYISILGSSVLFLSITYIIYLIVRKIFFSLPVAGYTSMIVSIWFLGGLTIFSIGVVGIYLSKVFIEVKNRPYVIIRAIYEKTKQ